MIRAMAAKASRATGPRKAALSGSGAPGVDRRIRLVSGNDEMRVKDRARALAGELAPPGDLAVEEIDGWVELVDDALRVVRAVREAVETPAFFSSAKLVWLKNAALFADGPLGRSEDVQEALLALVERLEGGLPEGVALLVSAISPDGRRGAFKRLQGLAVAETFDTVTGRDADEAASECVQRAFREMGRAAEAEACDRLAELCGTDPRLLRSEAEKVALYAGGGKVAVADVEEMATPMREETVWAVGDALMEGRTARAVALLKRLEFQRENPVGLLAAVVNHARLAFQCRVLLDRGLLRAGGRGPASVGPEGMAVLVRGAEGKAPSPFRLGRVASQAGRKPLAHWERVFEGAYQTYASFFDGAADPFRKLELFAMRLALLEEKA